VTLGGVAPRTTGAVPGERDLALVVRDAWSVVRLTKLHEVVQWTVDELGALNPRDLLGRDLTGPETEPANGPIALALAACNEELRYESGLSKSAEWRESIWKRVRQRMAEGPGNWADTFAEALAAYRHAAGRLVKLQCDMAVA
jgi:hypothetical protein